MWQEHNWGGVTVWLCGCLCMCVYVSPLLWCGNSMWIGSPCARKKKQDAVFIIKEVSVRFEGRRSSHEWQRGRLAKSKTLLPTFSSPSFLHTWLLSAAQTTSDMRFMAARSWVMSLVTSLFCLEHTFTKNYPHHFLSLQRNTSLRCVKINALLKVFSPLSADKDSFLS